MVFIFTAVAIRTVTLDICFACWPLRVKSKAVFSSQEIAEVEGIGWLPRLLRLLVRSGDSHWGQNLSHTGASETKSVVLTSNFETLWRAGRGKQIMSGCSQSRMA